MSWQNDVHIVLSPEEEHILQEWAGLDPTSSLAERANIILLSSQGVSTIEIARQLATSPAQVGRWREWFGEQRLTLDWKHQRTEWELENDQNDQVEKRLSRVFNLLVVGPLLGFGALASGLLGALFSFLKLLNDYGTLGASLLSGLLSGRRSPQDRRER